MNYDFTMCMNENCPLLLKCKRHKSHYNTKKLTYQSMSEFNINNSINCFMGDYRVRENYFKSKKGE